MDQKFDSGKTIKTIKITDCLKSSKTLEFVRCNSGTSVDVQREDSFYRGYLQVNC